MDDKEKRKRKNRRINRLLTAGMVICLCVFAFSAFKLLTIFQEYRAGEDEYKDLQQYVVRGEQSVAGLVPDDGAAETEQGEESSQAPDTEEPKDQEAAGYIPPEVDFESLREINPDVVGWLEVEALDISYPIVKGEDNEEYLHTTFEKQNNFSGAIFMDYENSADFSDCHTLIFGHNMKNQSMFGQLKFIKEQEKYKDSMYFWILTPEGKYRYDIFSAHVTPADGDTYTLFSGPDRSYVAYLEQMAAASEIPAQIDQFSQEDLAVTLTTCTSRDTERFVVQGIRVGAYQ